MIAAPSAARVGEDENALLVVHEGGGLGEVGPGGPALDGEAVDAILAPLAHDAARATGHLGDHVGPEPLHDLVERPLHGRQRGQALDQPVAPVNGVAALYRVTVARDGPGGQVALAVGERLIQLGREGVGEIVEHVLAGRDVDLDIAPLLGRSLRDAALHQRFTGRDDLHHAGVPGR